MDYEQFKELEKKYHIELLKWQEEFDGGIYQYGWEKKYKYYISYNLISGCFCVYETGGGMDSKDWVMLMCRDTAVFFSSEELCRQAYKEILGVEVH